MNKLVHDVLTYCIMNTEKTSKNIFMYIKMSRTLSAKYYQENKERLPKKARQRYQNFSEEEK